MACKHATAADEPLRFGLFLGRQRATWWIPTLRTIAVFPYCGGPSASHHFESTCLNFTYGTVYPGMPFFTATRLPSRVRKRFRWQSRPRQFRCPSPRRVQAGSRTRETGYGRDPKAESTRRLVVAASGLYYTVLLR